MMEKSDLEKGIRVGVWDVETTDLDPRMGQLVCVGVKDAITEKETILRVDDPRNPDKASDKWLVKEATKLLNSYNLLVGWYTTNFDWKFINSRCLVHKLPFPQKNFRRDLWFTSKSTFNFRSHSLKNIGTAAFGKTLKDSLDFASRNKVIRGDKRTIDKYVSHNSKDLKETLRVYKRFLPLLPTRLRRGS